MTQKNRETLKQYFKTGETPNEEQFADLIDSVINQVDDSITCDPDGQIGIGNSAPAANLAVRGNLFTPLSGKLSVEADATTITGEGTNFDSELAVGDAIRIGEQRFKIAGITDSTHAKLAAAAATKITSSTAYRDANLLLIENGNSAPQFVIDKSGNVGIGTDSPTAKLQVEGTVVATALQGDGAAISNLNADQITTGTIDPARISSLDAAKITGVLKAGQLPSILASALSGPLSVEQIPLLPASKLSGKIKPDQIPNLPAEKIVGTLTTNQLPAIPPSKLSGPLSAGMIASGTLELDRLPTIPADKISGLPPGGSSETLFYADPPVLDQAGMITLNWRAPENADVQLAFASSDSVKELSSLEDELSGNSYSVEIAQTTIFTLTVRMEGSVAAQVQLTVTVAQESSPSVLTRLAAPSLAPLTTKGMAIIATLKDLVSEADSYQAQLIADGKPVDQPISMTTIQDTPPTTSAIFAADDSIPGSTFQVQVQAIGANHLPSVWATSADSITKDRLNRSDVGAIVTKTVDVGFSPNAICVNEITNQIFVASRNTSSVTVIEGSDPYGTQEIEVVDDCIDVAVNPKTNKVYFVAYDAGNVTVVDGGDLSSQETIPVGKGPTSVAVDPGKNRIYVANSGDNTVTVYDGGDLSLIETVKVGDDPSGVVVNPTTDEIHVANMDDSTVTVINGRDFSTTTIKGVDLGNDWSKGAVNPKENKIYYINNQGTTVTVIDGNDHSKIKTIDLQGAQEGIAVNSTTNKIYVSMHYNHKVTVIDGSDHSSIDVSVGRRPMGVAMNSKTNKIFVTNQLDDTVTVIERGAALDSDE